MNVLNGSAFSACPRYDEKKVDAIIEKYCSVSAIQAEVAAGRGGIDVTKRIAAIRKALSDSGGPISIFGSLELDMIRKKQE